MTVTGIEETVARLAELDRKVQRTIVRKGLRAGAKVVQAKARAEAPKLTGLLARNVKVRSGGTRNGTTRVTIGVGAQDFKGDAFYGAFLVYGHRAGPRRLGDGRKLVAGRDFLSAALEAGQGAAVEATAKVWADEVEAATGGGS